MELSRIFVVNMKFSSTVGTLDLPVSFKVISGIQTMNSLPRDPFFNRKTSLSLGQSFYASTHFVLSHFPKTDLEQSLGSSQLLKKTGTTGVSLEHGSIGL